MSRRARAAAAENRGPTPEQQIAEYAFNIFGWALKIPGEIGDGATIVNAYEPSTTLWEKAVTAMEGCLQTLASDFISPLKPGIGLLGTAEEEEAFYASYVENNSNYPATGASQVRKFFMYALKL
jgi:hypothetical protein